MSRVFILGAGASCFARYPLGAQLWNFVRDGRMNDVKTNEAAEVVVPAIEALIAESSEDGAIDLEQLFTKQDLENLGRRELFPQRGDWNDIKEKLMSIISGAFMFHEFQLHEKLATPGSAEMKVIERWTSYVRDGDVIITFNWDILHEAALWRAGKWHYADGYGFSCSDVREGFVQSRVKILKLHGSVNWAQENKGDCAPSIEHKATFFIGASDGPATYLKGAGQWNAGRNLIVPSYLKDLTESSLLVHIWNQAAEALSTATEVLAIGYSLQPADAQARLLIASALLRNTNRPRIQIISPPGVDHWGKFCYSIAISRDRVLERFEDWIMNI